MHDATRRIVRRLEELGIKPQTAALQAGLKKDVIRDLTRKPDVVPRLETLEALAPVLGTTAAWLAFGDRQWGAEGRATAVPVLSWVAATRFHEAGTNYSEVEHYVPVVDPPGKRCFALTVVGDSMNLVAPEGSTVIVNPDDDGLVVRRFYVFRQGAETTFKRFMMNPMRLEPVSSNPLHEAIELTRETHIVGRVIRVITDL